MIFTLTEIAVLIIAVILIIFYHTYWQKVNSHFFTDNSILNNENNIELTFLCVFRNEEKHLNDFLQCIKSTKTKQNWKWLLINDHSSDSSLRIIEVFTKSNPDINISIINLPKNICGKKSAIDLGVRSANTDWIYCIDADVLFTESNINQLISETINSNAKLAFGPIKYEGGTSFIENYQIIENTALIALGRYHYLHNNPTMGNAANMLFQKKYYLELEPYKDNLQVMGGDDIFFIEKSWQKDQSLYLSNNPNTSFTTYVLKNWSELIYQRIRWTQKTKFQSTKKTQNSQIYLALFFSIYWGIIIHFGVKGLYAVSLLLLSFQVISNQIFLQGFLKKNNQKASLLRIIQASLFQPFFILFVGFAQSFTKGTWKGRTNPSL